MAHTKNKSHKKKHKYGGAPKRKPDTGNTKKKTKKKKTHRTPTPPLQDIPEDTPLMVLDDAFGYQSDGVHITNLQPITETDRMLTEREAKELYELMNDNMNQEQYDIISQLNSFLHTFQHNNNTTLQHFHTILQQLLQKNNHILF